jgi:hypothetical protein
MKMALPPCGGSRNRVTSWVAMHPATSDIGIRNGNERRGAT